MGDLICIEMALKSKSMAANSKTVRCDEAIEAIIATGELEAAE
jgi:hypothetical protein